MANKIGLFRKGVPEHRSIVGPPVRTVDQCVVRLSRGEPLAFDPLVHLARLRHVGIDQDLVRQIDWIVVHIVGPNRGRQSASMVRLGCTEDVVEADDACAHRNEIDEEEVHELEASEVAAFLQDTIEGDCGRRQRRQRGVDIDLIGLRREECLEKDGSDVLTCAFGRPMSALSESISLSNRLMDACDFVLGRR